MCGQGLPQAVGFTFLDSPVPDPQWDPPGLALGAVFQVEHYLLGRGLSLGNIPGVSLSTVSTGPETGPFSLSRPHIPVCEGDYKA